MIDDYTLPDTIEDDISSRGMPQSVDAEKTILGSLFLGADLDFVFARLDALAFLLDAHRVIYRAMRKMHEDGLAVDLITVAEYLKDAGDIQRISGVSYLSGLTEGLPRHLALDDYIAIVNEKARLRRVIEVSHEAARRAAANEESPEIVARLQNELENIGHLDDDDPLVAFATMPALRKMEERRKHGSDVLPTGHAQLDSLIGGLEMGFNTTVAARPGVGKTALAKQIICANCPQGTPIDFFSLEQTREQILWALWSLVSNVPFVIVRDPKQANEDEMHAIRIAAAEVGGWPLRIYDRTELKLGDILALARRSIHKNGSKCVIVDYAQNVDAPGRDERSRVSAVTSGLTRLVKHEKCALVMLSQFARPRSGQGYNTPPTIFDLKESSQLEQDAHTIVIIHRPWDEEASRISNEGEFIVAKQRFGDTGATPFHFNRRVVKFD